MPKTIIGFIGRIAGGKDVCKKYLMEKHGASSHRYSTVLRDIINRLYLPIDRNNMQNLSFDIRSRFGSDILAKVIIEDIRRDKNNLIVIDGIRRLDDVSSLQEEFPGLKMIGIKAAIETRYERMIKRNENKGDSEKTFAEFTEEDKKEAEQEIETVMAAAQHQVDNNGTLAELYAQIDEIIDGIKK